MSGTGKRRGNERGRGRGSPFHLFGCLFRGEEERK
jgi:hypothetical protein